jgi:hypothetical protein
MVILLVMSVISECTSSSKFWSALIKTSWAPDGRGRNPTGMGKALVMGTFNSYCNDIESFYLSHSVMKAQRRVAQRKHKDSAGTSLWLA